MNEVNHAVTETDKDRIFRALEDVFQHSQSVNALADRLDRSFFGPSLQEGGTTPEEEPKTFADQVCDRLEACSNRLSHATLLLGKLDEQYAKRESAA